MPSRYEPIDDPLDRQRARFCMECPMKKCVSCYDSPYINTKRKMFKRALDLGIKEETARAMFRHGDEL